ncbi:MAG TPA: hypothetical protein VFF27_10030 [Bacteroidia bacterium]|jgi:hypothetical protein|nr:hypothetical protein [Bacteroidia bacterium]
MIKTPLLLCFILTFTLSGFAQVTNISAKKLKTSKYAGLYAYGKNVEREKVGTIIIYPDSDSTVLFYFNSNTGPTAFKMDEYYGRLKVNNNIGIFTARQKDSEKGCQWRFTFSKKTILIETVSTENNCGFMAGITVDGNYNRQIKGIIEECLSLQGDAINFGAIKPEAFNRK